MNRKIAYPILIVCCIAIIIIGYRCWFNPVTTIILVRHAEKGFGQDPPLTDLGHKRAGALGHAVSSAGVNAIFVTEFLRTQQTADSAAALLGLIPETIPANSVDELVNRIKSDHQGEVVLVVGHSDTVPQIIQGLGISSPPAIPGTEFDNLFIVHRHKYGPHLLTHLRYGKNLCGCNP
jgi:broad specificity phosphatase PhoE